jgi:hypothetical protein
VFVLWTVTAVWALVTALIPRLRARSLVTAVLGGFLLLLATTAPEVGFAIDERTPLPWMIAIIALSAGLDLASRGHASLSARALALIGGLGLVWYHAKAFPAGETGSQLDILVGDAIRLFQGGLGDVREGYYAMLGGYWCFLIAALIGVLMALGLRKRIVSLIGFLLVLIGLLVPSFVALGQELGEGVTFDTARTIVLNRASVALVGNGVALWLLGVYATSDLVRSREAVA